MTAAFYFSETYLRSASPALSVYFAESTLSVSFSHCFPLRNIPVSYPFLTDFLQYAYSPIPLLFLVLCCIRRRLSLITYRKQKGNMYERISELHWIRKYKVYLVRYVWPCAKYGKNEPGMKRKRILFTALAVYLIYTCCTTSGAIKLQALIISRNPAVYLNSTEISYFGKPYYTFQNEVTDYETANPLGVFECHRYFIFVTAEYVGFP